MVNMISTQKLLAAAKRDLKMNAEVYRMLERYDRGELTKEELQELEDVKDKMPRLHPRSTRE